MNEVVEKEPLPVQEEEEEEEELVKEEEEQKQPVWDRFLIADDPDKQLNFAEQLDAIVLQEHMDMSNEIKRLHNLTMEMNQIVENRLGKTSSGVEKLRSFVSKHKGQN